MPGLLDPLHSFGRDPRRPVSDDEFRQGVRGLLGLDAMGPRGLFPAVITPMQAVRNLKQTQSQSAGPRPTKAIEAPAQDDGLPQGVDWEFLKEREGGSFREGYVPKKKNETPHENSGVTIGAGFDLGKRTERELRSMGLPPKIVEKMRPYLGIRGQKASDLAEWRPLIVSPDEEKIINETAFNYFYNNVSKRFNSATGGRTRFEDLPGEAQTVILSVAYNYGPGLEEETPSFWGQVTTGRWSDAYDELMHFNDAHSPRRELEAVLLGRAIKAGTLPRSE